MKKIMYFIDYSLNVIGGAQGSTLVISKLLKEIGYDIKIVQPKEDDNQYEIEVIEYNQKDNIILDLIFKSFEFTKILKKNDYDIVHAQMPFCGIILGVLKKMNIFPKNKKLVFTDRGLISLYSNHTKFLLKNLAKYSDAIICTTEVNKKYWNDFVGKKDKVFVIGNTLDKNFKEYDDNKRTEIRQNSNISKNEIVIGFAGRVTSTKNWPLAIEICKELISRNIRIKVALALTAYSKEEKEELKNLIYIISNIVGNENMIIGSELTQKEMSDFYYNVDIFILTSLKESFGKTVLEAMSRKCCVLTTNCIGTPEVVGDNKFVIIDNTAKLFVDKIIYYINNTNELLKDKEKLYNRYLNEYTEERILEKHINMYKNLY